MPSHSPDGGPQRKASRPQASREGSNNPNAQNGSSRRSSISNGDPRRPTVNTALKPAGEQQLSARPQADIHLSGKDGPAKESDGLFVKSPESHYSDAPSTRSTPQPPGPAPMKPPAAQMMMTPVTETNESEVQMKDTDSAASETSIFNDLMNFSNQAAKIASYQFSYDQADDRLKRATKEFDSMEPHFGTFPAIREQKTVAKTLAEKDFNLAKNKLKEHKAKQEKHAKELAAAIAYKAEVQPVAQTIANASEERTDSASRAGLEALQKSLDDLTQQAAKANRCLGQVPAIHGRLDKLEQKMKAVPTNAFKAGASNDADALRDRVQKLEDSALDFARKSHAALDAGGILERVVELESKLATVKHELPSSADLEPLANRVQAVEDHIKRIDSESNEKDAMVLQEIATEFETRDKEIAAIKDGIVADFAKTQATLGQYEQELQDIKTSLTGAASAEAVDQLRASCQALEGEVGHVKTASEGAASSEALGQLRAACELLEKEVKIIQEHQDKAVGSSSVTEAMNIDRPQFQAPAVQSNGFMPLVVEDDEPALTNGVPKPPSSYSEAIKELHLRCDGLVGVTQHLKQRYDNLTTDEVCMAMAIQMSEMYPAARDFQRAVDDISMKHAKLANRVTQLDNMPGGKVIQLEKEVVNLRSKSEARQTGSSPPPPAADSGSNQAVTKRLGGIDSRLDSIEKVAKDAQTLSKGNSTRYSNLNPEATKKSVDEMLPRLDTVETQTKKHTGFIEKGTKAIQDLSTVTEAQQVEIGKIMGRVDAMNT